MHFHKPAPMLRLALIAVALAGVSAARADTVYPNNAGGDVFTNPGPANAGQAVGSSGWYYNNVRNGGTEGINGTYPRSGNGSVQMGGPANAKADIEYLANGVKFGTNYEATGSLGKFSQFSAMSYDWFRNSSSTNDARQAPALRILLDRDGNLATTGDRGGLVFEMVYNSAGGPVSTDVWNSIAVGAATNLWNFGLGLGNTYDLNGSGYAFDDTLAQWQASSLMTNAVILGFSSGIGSGWNGTFDGAVDNIGWTIDGASRTTNFELAEVTAIPEPGSLALVAAALTGLGLTLRRRQGEG
jgi:hypothetical protein